MSATISCHDAAALMASDALYAVFDIRERGEFNTLQIRGATSLARSQIEFRIADLVPNRRISIVVYDDGGKRATLAAATLEELSYADVRVLEGGLASWRQAGLPTATGVNVPSKAFGEHVHHEGGIPDVEPEELKALQDNATDLLILDMRTPEEFGRFCIPGAINVPGGDVVLWAQDLKRIPEKSIIVNCAGRTRSIIGTAALRRLGVKNVRALKNGTMGWVLAGFELEIRPKRQAMFASEGSRDKATALALQLATEEGILWITAAELSTIKSDPENGVTYVIDVRSETEFSSGHLPGSLNVPGGQAVQRADDFVPVRNANIVFVSNSSARAIMAAYWYRQMGFPKVMVLQGGLRAWRESGKALTQGENKTEPLGYQTAATLTQWMEADELETKLKDSRPVIVDVGPSLDFEAGHIPGAYWISRGWLELKLPEHFGERNQPLVLTCADGRNSVLAAQALGRIGYTDVAVLQGGVQAWASGGKRTEAGLDRCLVEPNDVVLSPSIRGNKEDMRRYLEWEVTLTENQRSEVGGQRSEKREA